MFFLLSFLLSSTHVSHLCVGSCYSSFSSCYSPLAGVFPVVISQGFALALTIYTVATQLLLYYVRSPR